MPRRSRVSPAQAAAAVTRIAARRTGAGDPDLHRLGEHPEEVVAYVHRHRRVSDEVMRADVVDALLLVDALAEQLDRHRLRLIQVAREAGMTLAALAVPLGKRSPQAVSETIRRLEGAVAGGTKDAAAVYAARRARIEEQRRAAVEAAAVEGYCRVLVDAAGRLPVELGEDLEEIRVVLRRAWSGEDVAELLAARLRLLLGELAGVPLDAELGRVVVDAAQFVGR